MLHQKKEVRIREILEIQLKIMMEEQALVGEWVVCLIKLRLC